MQLRVQGRDRQAEQGHVRGEAYAGHVSLPGCPCFLLSYVQVQAAVVAAALNLAETVGRQLDGRPAGRTAMARRALWNLDQQLPNNGSPSRLVSPTYESGFLGAIDAGNGNDVVHRCGCLTSSTSTVGVGCLWRPRRN